MRARETNWRQKNAGQESNIFHNIYLANLEYLLILCFCGVVSDGTHLRLLQRHTSDSWSWCQSCGWQTQLPILSFSFDKLDTTSLTALSIKFVQEPDQTCSLERYPKTSERKRKHQILQTGVDRLLKKHTLNYQSLAASRAASLDENNSQARIKWWCGNFRSCWPIRWNSRRCLRSSNPLLYYSLMAKPLRQMLPLYHASNRFPKAKPQISSRGTANSGRAPPLGDGTRRTINRDVARCF